MQPEPSRPCLFRHVFCCRDTLQIPPNTQQLHEWSQHTIREWIYPVQWSQLLSQISFATQSSALPRTWHTVSASRQIHEKTCKNNVLMYTIVRYCDHTSVNSFVFTCSWFHQANSYGGATLAMVHDPVLSEKAQTLHHFLPVWEFTGNYSSAIQHLYNLIPTEVQTWNRIKHVWFLTFQYTMFTCWEVRSYQFHMEKTQTWNCWTLSWQSICKGLKNAVSECKF